MIIDLSSKRQAVTAIRKMDSDQQWTINRQAAIDCGNRERMSTGTLHSAQRLDYWRKANSK